VHFIGRSTEQVEEFLGEVVQPILARHGSSRKMKAVISV